MNVQSSIAAAEAADRPPPPAAFSRPDATVGFARPLRLIPAELGGDLAAVAILLFVAGPAIETHALAAAALKISAGLWLAATAVRLWRNAGECVSLTRMPVEKGRVLVTTFLNPKAFVFAFTIIPPRSPAPRPNGCLVSPSVVVLTGAFWISSGPRSPDQTAARSHRLSHLTHRRRGARGLRRRARRRCDRHGILKLARSRLEQGQCGPPLTRHRTYVRSCTRPTTYDCAG